MNASACNHVHTFNDNDPDIPVNLDGTPETETLRLTVAHFPVINPVTFVYRTVCLILKRKEHILPDFTHVGLYRENVLPLMDGKRADAMIREHKSREQMLGCMLLHVVISVLPVQGDGNAVTGLKTGCVLHHMKNLITLMQCITVGDTFNPSPVSRLASALRVAYRARKIKAFGRNGGNRR